MGAKIPPRRLDAIADHARDLILVLREDGALVDANEAAIVAYGYPRERLLELNIVDLRVKSTQAAVAGQIDEAQDHGILFETEHRRADGSTFPCEVSSRGIELDGEKLLVSVIRDIANRKRGQAALDQSERLLAKLFQGGPIGIAIVRLADRRWIEVSQTFCHLLELERSQIVGHTVYDIGLSPDPASGARIEELVAQRRPGEVEMRLRLGSGRSLELLFSLEFLDIDGQACAIGFAHDVTERNRLAEQLRHSQKMEAIGRLAGGVAHDFNNILTAILGQSELLEESLPPNLPERRQAEQIRRSAGRAAALTRQLLVLGRKQVMQLKVFDLNEVVGSLSVMLERLIGEDLTLEVDFSPDLGAVRADPTQLEQVVLNLVLNARDAMPDGGRVTVRTANVTAEEAAGFGLAGPAVLLEVEDTGCGMDEETRRRAFEPFFTTKPSGKGSGLGLSIVYGIVTQSGGQVVIDSARSAGTRFRIYLPRVAAPLDQLRAAAGAATPRGSETVLLVEDDIDVREFIHTILRAHGYDVLPARDGPEALAHACDPSQRIDLLLTDVVMPRMNGSEVASRAAAMRPSLKVLYISGYPGDVILQQGVLAPGVRLLQKPFSVRELTVRVRATLDG